MEVEVEAVEIGRVVEVRLVNCSLDKKVVEEELLRLQEEYNRLEVLEDKLVAQYLLIKEKEEEVPKGSRTYCAKGE